MDTVPLTLADLDRLMREAAARDDFEAAASYRNRLFVARQAGLREDDLAPEAEGEIARQQPGAMGIGSQHPKPSRPEGWTPPKKPPPMTRNTGRRRD